MPVLDLMLVGDSSAFGSRPRYRSGERADIDDGRERTVVTERRDEAGECARDAGSALKLIGFVDREQDISPATLAEVLAALGIEPELTRGGSVTVERRPLIASDALSGVVAGADDAEVRRWPAAVDMISVRFPANCLPPPSRQLSSLSGVSVWIACFLVNENVKMAGEPRGDGVIRVAFMARRPDISRSDFERLWGTEHAELVMASGPLFHRYVANIVLGDGEWDGILEQWFVDEDEQREHDRLVREEKDAVRADIGRFLGRAHAIMVRPGRIETSER